MKRISFTEGEETAKLFSDIKKIQDESDKSFSECAREGLQLVVQKYQVTEGIEPTEVDAVRHLESLMKRLRKENPERYPDWKTCLEGNHLLNDKFAIKYSLKKGWLKPADTPYEVLKEIEAEESHEDRDESGGMAE